MFFFFYNLMLLRILELLHVTLCLSNIAFVFFLTLYRRIKSIETKKKKKGDTLDGVKDFLDYIFKRRFFWTNLIWNVIAILVKKILIPCFSLFPSNSMLSFLPSIFSFPLFFPCQVANEWFGRRLNEWTDYDR